MRRLKRRIAVLQQLLELVPVDQNDSSSGAVGDPWDSMHSKVVEAAKKKFHDGHTSDAVRAAYVTLNNTVKEAVRQKIKEELDGAKLMNKAFGGDTPLFNLADRFTQSGRDFQTGHALILAGAMIGIRNPPAHETADIPKRQALDQLVMCSCLFSVVEPAITASSTTRSPVFSKNASMPGPLPASQIPAPFHDRTPRRGPWIAGDVVPDRPGSGYQVLLADGSTEAATWLFPEFSASGAGY